MAFRIVKTMLVAAALARAAQHPSAPSSSDAGEKAISLVETGQCQQALPSLKRLLPQTAVKSLRYRMQMAEARCAMALDQEVTVLDALIQLRKEFPDDPEVLYVSTHYFSQLAMHTSEELARKAPTSYQARRLEAEAFESQGKWDEAAGLYRGIAEANPQLPGIHYRLGQVLLSKAGDTGSTDEAKSEFQRELEVDPKNAAAEFVLGELARRAGDWNEAVQHFSRAAKLDASFNEAYLALGMSLSAENKFADAVPPLENYVRLQPDDPAGHYQLAIAYARTNNKEGADREMLLQKQLSARGPVSH